MLIAEENQLQTQIDRACAAQSPAMLPKTSKKKPDREAEINQINARINSYFQDQ